MSLIDLQRAAVAVCCAEQPPAEQLAALGDDRIWRMYRELVRKRLRGELRIALRRTASAASAAFDRAFEHHMASAPPRTRFFHAVVECFVQSAAPFLRADPTVPPWLADLLEYEGALWAVSDLPDAVPAAPLSEFAFDKRPVLSPALRLLRLGHAVHKKPGPDGGYEPGDVYLCVHRRPEEKRAKTWVLNAVSYELLQRFGTGAQPASEDVRQVAAARGLSVNEKFLDGLCTVLADLIDRGIILGAR